MVYGPWWTHVEEFVQHASQNPNILIIYYEQLSQNPFESVKAIAKFLGKDISDEELRKTIENCSFEAMKNNPQTNIKKLVNTNYTEEGDFYRKGEIGDWKNSFTSEQAHDFDQFIASNLKVKLNFGLKE